jgi:hypothetical protein
VAESRDGKWSKGKSNAEVELHCPVRSETKKKETSDENIFDHIQFRLMQFFFWT